MSDIPNPLHRALPHPKAYEPGQVVYFDCPDSGSGSEIRQVVVNRVAAGYSSPSPQVPYYETIDPSDLFRKVTPVRGDHLFLTRRAAVEHRIARLQAEIRRLELQLEAKVA